MPQQVALLRFAVAASACASLALAGCAGGLDNIGGRPLVYKQGPGDAPRTIEGSEGAVHKRIEPAPSSAMAAPQPAPVPSPAPRPSRSVAQAEPAPPPAPRAQAPAAPRPEPPTPRTNIAQAAQPAAVSASDLFRYTQASRYGDMLFVSGQIAVDLRNGAFDVNSSIEAQTRQALENIRTILEANHMTMANVVSATVYLSSISRLSAMDGIYHDFFKGTPPARTVVEVSNLPRGALVEISAVAGR